MKKYQIHRHIICLDLKSFYASVECALRGLDPFNTMLVVADKSRGDGSICLATTPYLKQLGAPNRGRIFELPEHLKNDIIYARPRMKTYLEYTMKLIEIYLSFISDEDLYVYSIDEAFLDVTNYLSYYKKTDIEIAEMIIKEIETKLKLPVSCGIGPNMLLAKLALDLEGKHLMGKPAKWTYDNFKLKLWPITPLSKMWGIGHRMERHLNILGIYSIGDLANYNVSELKRRFGVIGEELYYHANGIDMSLVQDKDKLRSKNKSFGNSQVLFEDYYVPDFYTILLEMVDELARRLRLAKKVGKTLTIGIRYSKDVGGGFSRQRQLDYPTSCFSEMMEMALSIFNDYYDGESAIRAVSIAISNLSEVSSVHQLSLFEDYEKLEREEKLLDALDNLKLTHGKSCVNRLSSLTEASTIQERNKFIGGHHE
ncbi:MAG: Y-family DNA polymerase [Acholeplasmataceae bacterium]|jgi:DNA polymerase V